jgi:hypothetical protein
MSQTPMTEAILALLGNLAQELARRNAPPGSVHAYVFGGAAVHILTRRRVSEDLDVELLSSQMSVRDVVLLAAQLPPVDFVDSEGRLVSLEIDHTYNPTLGPLHEDYRERAALLEGTERGSLRVFVPSPEDVAITKLGRLSPVDLDDIVALLAVPGVSVERFRQLAMEAESYYVGNHQDLTSKLQYVIEYIRKNRDES